jgi:hypothetical protein
MRRTDAGALAIHGKSSRTSHKNVNFALSLRTLQSFVNANDSLCNGRRQSCKIACRYHCRRDALHCLTGVIKITLRRTALQPLHVQSSAIGSHSFQASGASPAPSRPTWLSLGSTRQGCRIDPPAHGPSPPAIHASGIGEKRSRRDGEAIFAGVCACRHGPFDQPQQRAQVAARKRRAIRIRRR